MIRKLSHPTDLTEFKNWAGKLSRSPEFNWSELSLQESLEREICFGLWVNSELKSVVCFLGNSDPTEILWLATDPQNEKRGFMKELLTELIHNTTHNKLLRGGQILLEVHQMNLKAIRLYSSLGFHEFGRRKNYYKDGSQALLLALKVE